jgi:hypothetical protein
LPNGETIATTCLLIGKFDILAVNLFEFGHTWRFGFAKNADLPRSTHRAYTPVQRQYLLATGIRMTWPLEPPFRSDPFSLLDEVVEAKRQVRTRRPKESSAT